MGEGSVVTLGVTKGFKRGHLYVIQFLRVIGTISTVSDRRTQTAEKLLRMAYASCLPTNHQPPQVAMRKPLNSHRSLPQLALSRLFRGRLIRIGCAHLDRWI